MKKLLMSAAILATLAAPAFAQSYYGQPVSPEQARAMRAQPYAPDWSARAYAPDAYSAQAYAPGWLDDNVHASMLSPGSLGYVPDYNH